jgi:glycosyltransferase involved in cell wall biosynthesis
MKPVPRVLIGITTRNRAGILPKALASALAQTHPAILVAVLDDGSTDETPSLRTSFPSVRWSRHEVPQGIIESRNELMRSTDADYYVSLDDDAWFIRNDELSLAVALLEAQPPVAAVAFDILSPDRSEAVDRGPSRPVGMFIGCGHIARMAAVRSIGYYATSPGTYGSEEKDLALRLADMGLKIHLMPGVHVWHAKAWGDRDHFAVHRSGVCNELVMTLRRCPLPDLLLVLPLKLLSFMVFWLRQPRFLAAGLAGAGFALRHLPSSLCSRAPVRRSTFWAFVRSRSTR